MKKVKRILALSLSAVLLLALLCACGDPGAQNSGPAGGNTSDPSAPASQGPSAEPPVGSVQVDLAAFYLALAGKYQVPETPEQAIPDELADDDDMWLDGPESREERLQSLEQQRNDLRDMTMMNYPGLTDIATEQCLVYAPMMSFSASEAALIQVSSAADVDAVKAILQARVDAQKNGGAWYPAAVEGWENNSRIVSNGSYIMLIVGEDCDAIVDEFNAVMADPSYVPAPNPGSRDNDPAGGSPDDSSPDVPGIGDVVVPGGDTEPGGEPAAPGFGGVTVPGWDGGTDPGDEPDDDPEPSESTPSVVVPPILVGPGFGGGGSESDPQPSVEVNVPEELVEKDFDAFFSTIAVRYGFPEMVNAGIDVANVYYPGLADLDLVQFCYRIPAFSGGTNVTEIVLVQVKNNDDGYKAVKILQDRIDSMRNGGAIYPQDREAWTNSAQVAANGSCILLVVNSNYKEIIDFFNSAF